MTAPDYDPELVATAVDAVANGASLRDVAVQVGVSHMTVRRWVAAAGAKPRMGRPPKPAAPSTPPPLEPEPPADTRDTLEIARAAFARMNARAEREDAAGNAKLANDIWRQAQLYLDRIRQIEEARTVDGGDTVTFTKDELAAGAALVRERLAAEAEHRAAAGGMVCAECGERLRLEFASGGAVPDLQGRGS